MNLDACFVELHSVIFVCAHKQYYQFIWFYFSKKSLIRMTAPLLNSCLNLVHLEPFWQAFKQAIRMC